MKRLPLALALSALVCLSAGAQVLADFGSASFSPDYDLSDFATITQSSTSLSVEGLDNGQTLAGYFATTLDFSDVTTLYLTASLQGAAPDSMFTVLLFNTDFSQTRTYESAFNHYGAGRSTLALILASEDSGFTDIAGFQLIANGIGAPLAFTLDNLSASPTAVPEPGTYALFAGLLTLGYIMIRRRRGPR